MDFMDKVIEVTISNLYTIRIDGHIIRFTNFSFKNKGHLAVLYIARSARDVLGLDVEMDMGFFKFYWYNLKYKYSKFCKRHRSSIAIDPSEVILDIERANNKYHLFEKIYETYYERK